MGTQVQYKEYAPGYRSMRNLGEEASSSNWPLFYGDRTLANGQYCNGFTSRGYDKDAVKQKMLEHEAIFKNQVSELHRLYRIQRDMMQEVKMKESNRMSVEPSSSSNILGSQLPFEDARKWHMAGFPLAHCGNEIVNSPLSAQSGRVQLQNGFSPKNRDLSEARPSKVQKRLFDLQLPAEQYIDTDDDGEQQLRGRKASFSQSYPANVKPFLGGGETSSSRNDAPMSGPCFRGAFGLADLNEPARFEEVTTTPVDFIGHCSNSTNDAKSPNFTSKNNVTLLASSRETMWNSHLRPDGPIGNSSAENKGKERDWVSCTYGSGNAQNNRLPVSRGFEPNMLPMPARPVEALFDRTHQHHGIYNRDELWREKTGYGLQHFERGPENSNFSHVGPTGSSLFLSSNRFVNSSEFPNSSSHSVLALEMQGSSSTQKLNLFHLNSQFSRSSLAEREKCNGVIENGFYHGPPLKSKEQSLHYNSPAPGQRSENVLPERSAIVLGSNSKDSKSAAKGFDLNVMNTDVDEESVEVVAPILPWLKSKTENVASTSSKCEIKAEKETGEARNVRKILGVPILENDSSLLVSSSTATRQEENRNEKKKNIVIDINMAWDQSSGEEETDSKSSIRNHIDLNSCVPEEDDQPGKSTATATGDVRTRNVLDIDLEAPIVLDSEEDDNPREEEQKPEQARDEVASVAAEAIVAIALSDPLGKSLEWFADVISSRTEELENPSSEGMDDFEAMTLRLTETKEEDYMPKPFVPEFPFGVNAGHASAPNRPRRGQSRRGRPRRDFQRDILPGMVSLSRNEVTEDLQTFGGLMRASGHSWTSGPTRRNGARNGGTRGRRRAVVIDTGPPLPPPPPPLPPPSSVGSSSITHQLNNIGAVLEDNTLTGWGRTPRRPRRQRCPPGNPPPVPLT